MVVQVERTSLRTCRTPCSQWSSPLTATKYEPMTHIDCARACCAMGFIERAFDRPFGFKVT